MLLYISVVFIGLYVLLIIFFIIGWRRNSVFENFEISNESTPVTIIVACKNEEENIHVLISSLAAQNYTKFKLILVNDHSTDKTQEYICDAIKVFPHMKYHSAIGVGKKNALKEGIYLSDAELIVLLDADCIPTPYWLWSIVSFQQKHPSDLIICPIQFSDNSTLFSTLQCFEFASLVAVGAAAAGAGKPILCNGANLAFTRSAWENSKDDLQENELSGDDIFLLQSVKRSGGVIRFLKSNSAFVTTHPAKDLFQFFNQRRRWAAKSPSYTDWDIIITALIVFIVALLELVLLVLAVFNTSYLYWFCGFFTLKLLVDFAFLSLVGRFFSLKNVWLNSILLSIVYPFYIFFVGVSALLVKPKKW